MSAESPAADRLTAALEAEWWIEETAIDDVTGDVTVETSQPPDLRSVYAVIADVAAGEGTVVVDGPSGAWAIDHADGDVRDVYRTGGEYTVNRLSRLERVSLGLTVFGVYLFFATVVTAAASLGLTTPLDLLGVGTLVGLGAMLAGSLGCAVGGLVLFVVVPGVTTGEVAADPGEGIEGFEALSPADRAALIAIDDAKSERDVGAMLRGEKQVLGLVGAFGFAAYLGLIGWLNFGAIGLLVSTGLFPLRSAIQITGTWFLLGRIEPLDDGYVSELLEEIAAAAGSDLVPTVIGYGDPDEAVHEHVAMAVPSLELILLPNADVEKLHVDELHAILAHEYEHVRSHAPVGLLLLKAGFVLLPGIALLMTGATPTPLVIGVGLFGYFAAINAGLGHVMQRWEYQADAFASEVASPLGLAFGLTRVAARPVIDATDTSPLSGPTGELYGTHPYPHRRFVRLVRAATA